MANEVEFPIRITVDASGAKKGGQQTEDALDRVEKKGKRVNSALKTAFQAITFLGGVNALVRLEDQADNVNDRLRSVTGSAEEAAKAYDALLDVSQETATAFAGNAETFARLTRVQGILGTSIQDNIDLIFILNTVLRSSGDSADEARGGINRLVVALTSGDVAGRELTQILRQLPAIASLLAKQFGVTEQRLLTMGDRGELSVERIIGALLRFKAEAKKLAEEDVATLSEALIRLQNLGVAALNDLAKSSRIAGKAISDAQGDIQDEGLLSFLNKFVILGKAVTGVAIDNALGNERAASELDNYVEAIRRVTEKLQEQSKAQEEANKQARAALEAQSAAKIEKQTVAFEDLTRALNEERLVQEALIRQGEPAARVRETLNELARKSITLTDTQIAQAIKLAANVQKVADAAKLKEELLGPELALQRQLAAVELLRAEALGNATGEGVANMEMLQLALERSAERTLRLRLETEELRNELSGNFRVGLIDAVREITSVGEAVQEGVRNTFQATEDGLVSLVRTGKLNFQDLANSILDDIARILVRLLVLQGIQLFAGGAGGGLGGLIGGIAAGGARQHGGHVTPGGQYLVGERGPELFTPTEPGRIMPNPVGPGPAFGGSPEVKLLVVNVTDPKEVENVIASGAVDRVLVNRVSRNKRAMDQARRE